MKRLELRSPNFSLPKEKSSRFFKKVCKASDLKSGNNIWDQLLRLRGNNACLHFVAKRRLALGPQAGDCKL